MGREQPGLRRRSVDYFSRTDRQLVDKVDMLNLLCYGLIGNRL